MTLLSIHVKCALIYSMRRSSLLKLNCRVPRVATVARPGRARSAPQVDGPRPGRATVATRDTLPMKSNGLVAMIEIL